MAKKKEILPDSDDESEEIMLPLKSNPTKESAKKPAKKPAKKATKSKPKETTDSPTKPTKKPRKKRTKKPCPKGHDPCDCPPKAKRKPTAYAQFVKDNYHTVRDKPCCDRFKILAKKWREQKAKTST